MTCVPGAWRPDVVLAIVKGSARGPHAHVFKLKTRISRDPAVVAG